MRNDITVSICITTYNMEKYIARAIESVLMQKADFDYEIIVADDASTDETLSILQSYQQNTGERFKILYAENNRGVMENFVNALKNARGKYIAPLDADDYWIDEYKLQKQVNILDGNENIGFVHSNYYFVDEETKDKGIAKDKRYSPPEENRFVKRLLHYDIAISTSCIRKCIIDFEELEVYVQKKFFSQDYVLFLSLIPKADEYYMKEPMLAYSIIKNSRSHSSDMFKRVERFKKIFEISIFFAEKHNVEESVKKRLLFNSQMKILLTSWRTHDFTYVKSYAKDMRAVQFIKYNPKALYVFVASRNKALYKLFYPWLLRKRRVGK